MYCKARRPLVRGPKTLKPFFCDFKHVISPLSVSKKTSVIVCEVITVRMVPLSTHLFCGFALPLKGHGNEPVFPTFLHKPVRHGFLTIPIEPFRFWLQILGDIRNRKTTPSIGESGSRQDCLELPFFQTFRLINCDSKFHPWPIFCQIVLLKAWFNRLKV
jgi:hypothetical protein